MNWKTIAYCIAGVIVFAGAFLFVGVRKYVADSKAAAVKLEADRADTEAIIAKLDKEALTACDSEQEAFNQKLDIEHKIAQKMLTISMGCMRKQKEELDTKGAVSTDCSMEKAMAKPLVEKLKNTSYFSCGKWLTES